MLTTRLWSRLCYSSEREIHCPLNTRIGSLIARRACFYDDVLNIVLEIHKHLSTISPISPSIQIARLCISEGQ